MAGKEKITDIEKKPINPQHRSLKEQKQFRLILIGFITTAAIILGLVGYGVWYEAVGKYRTPVAMVEDRSIDTNYFIERVRLERNAFIQQMRMVYAQSQFYAGDTNSVEYFQNQLGSYQTALDDVQGFAGDVLDRMIDELVALVEADKRGIVVDDEAVEKAVQQLMFRYFPDGTPIPTSTPTIAPIPTYSPTQEAILKITQTAPENSATISAGESAEPTATAAVSDSTFLPTPTPYTFELYQSAYGSYIDSLKEINVTETSLRTYLTNYLINLEVYEAVTADTPREEEKVWARHILVKTEGEALIVLNRLANGEDWATVAADISLDTSNKDAGGDLGWFGKGMMVAEFEQAAFDLEVGEISSPVQTSFGWHIIQSIGHDTLSMNDSEYQSAKDMFYSNWLAEQKNTLRITKGTQWKDLAPSDPVVPADLRVP